jgi:hypothetical protein
MCDSGARLLCVHKSLTVILHILVTPSFWNNRKDLSYTSLRFLVIKEFHLILTKTVLYYKHTVHYVQGFAVKEPRKELLVLYLQYMYIVYRTYEGQVSVRPVYV